MIAIVLVLLSLFAFPISVRKTIGRRDNWTCQGCGRKFSEGWMVHASHFPHAHSKTHPDYNTEEGGDIRCVHCHAEIHIQGTTLGHKGDLYALDKLEITDEHTYEWRQKNG